MPRWCSRNSAVTTAQMVWLPMSCAPGAAAAVAEEARHRVGAAGSSSPPRTLRSATAPAWQCPSGLASRVLKCNHTSCTSATILWRTAMTDQSFTTTFSVDRSPQEVRRHQRRARLVVGGGRGPDRRGGRDVHLPGQGPAPLTDPGLRAGSRRARRVDGPRELHELRRGPDRVGRHADPLRPDRARRWDRGPVHPRRTPAGPRVLRRVLQGLGATTCARACRTSSRPGEGRPEGKPDDALRGPEPSLITG